nr:ribonuclease H-like domain-containing protein [Tanacetum cinerariifolium]
KGHFAMEYWSSKDPRRAGVVEPQRRTIPVETSKSNALVSQCDGLESVEARHLVYKQNESIFEEKIKLLNIEVQLRDTALATLRQKLDKAEKDRDDMKLNLEKFQTSYKNLTKLLASQIIPPPYTGTFMPPKLNLVFNTAPTADETAHLAFNVQLSPTKSVQDLSHKTKPSAPIIEDWLSDSDTKYEPKALQLVPSFAQSSKHVKSPRHSVQPIATTILAATPAPANPKSNSSGQKRNRKACFVCRSVDILIKDCDFHTKQMAQPTQRNYAHMGHHKQPVSVALPTITLTRPRHAYHVAPVVSDVQGKQGTWGNPQQALKDKGVIKSGCSRHMIGNMSYLSDFEELNKGYVSFGGNPKGGKITGKGKIKTGKLDFYDVYFVKELKFILFSVSQMCDKKNSVLFTDTECLVSSLDFKLPDESQVLLRVPRENNMYNVNLKNIIPSGDLTCLFAKATLDESNLWHKRLAHAEAVDTACYVHNRMLVTKPHNKTPYELLHGRTPSFGFMRPFGCLVTILNTLDPLAKFNGKVDEGFLVGYPEINLTPGACFQDTFDAEKAREEVDQTYMLFPVWSVGSTNPKNMDEDASFDGKEHDFDAKKSESEVILSPRKFEDCSKNSSNEVNAASSIVSTVGQNPLNNINTFSVVGPSNDVVSPTYGKSSFIHAYQLPDDKDMPESEDIIYSDDEDVVGAEADFNNLESSIPEDGIDYEEVFAPVTRIKDIRLFLACASFMGFMVDQIDVKSAFLYGTIEEEVYVCQPSGFEDPDHRNKVYKVVKALYGLHQAPRAWRTYILLGSLGKSASTPIDTEKPLLKDPDGEDVDVHTYSDLKSFISSCSKKDLYISKSYIEYALTVNPNIYVSYIKQFWNTVVVKQTNDVTRLQALVDRKKVVISEAAMRDALRLDDAEGVDCLPNEEIFAELARMGYEKPSTKLTFYKAFFSSQWKFLIHTILQSMSAKHTSWNEFSSAMVSVVICLSTGRRFTFSKYIFKSLVRNVDSTSKFYMYPQFLQLLIRNQLGIETPLFEGMLVAGVIEKEGDAEEQVQDDVDDAAVQGADNAVQRDAAQVPSIPSPTPPTPPPQQSQDLPSTSQVQHTLPQSPQPQSQSQPQAQQQAADFLVSFLHEALDAVVALTRRVKHLEYDKVAQALEITKLKKRRIDTSEDTMIEDGSSQGRMIDDKDDAAVLMDDKEEEKKEEEVKDDQVQGRQAEIYKIDMDHASKVLSMQEDDQAKVQEVVDVVTTAKLITEIVTAASEIVTAVSTTISAVEPQVPAAAITPAAPVRVVAASTRRRKRVAIRDLEEESTTIIPADTKSKYKGKEIMVEEFKPMKKKQQVEMDEDYARKLDYFKGMSYDDIRPIFEAKFNSNIEFLLKTKEQLEEEENRAIQSINETLAQKAAKRRKLNKEVEDLKKHLKIVHDEDDDVYIEATPLARKVPVMDYEIIHLNNKPHYKIIRTDGTHQLPDGQAQVWKNQRTAHGQAKVKSWKVLESCDVHIITFTATRLILLVERRYPLSSFGVEAAMDLEEKHQVFNAAGEELSAAKQSCCC